MTSYAKALDFCAGYDRAYPWAPFLLSLIECGQTEPLVLNDAMIGWDGRHRIVAAHALGLELRTTGSGSRARADDFLAVCLQAHAARSARREPPGSSSP